MKMLIFTVFDSAVGAYLQPFFSRSHGEAIRSFQDACNDAKSQFNQHAMDYTLFHLGSFDDGGGVFDCNPPSRVASAIELIIKSDDIVTPAPWELDSKVRIGQR
ncbi:nonstructural protein [Blackfly microvirus SF02]|uniref:Nonstructural protein n=1 Tax=Blackfly microvirus SF02 TaxID=2576452 RepID=A0A4P8PJT0_9VIRU|nr:nonstructural protein [Blackfly microvirus SF02]